MMDQPRCQPQTHPQEMAVKPDLAPCPFCGSVDLVFNRWTHGGTAYVHCRDCMADGPYFGADDGFIL